MARELTIAGVTVDDESDCYVIAEIGHNHQGDMDQARRMIEEAARAGASAVKLQKRDNRSLFTTEFYGQVYNSLNSFGATYGEHREALEFDHAQYRELKALADDLGVHFFATAFDIPSAELLESLDVPAYKIASGDLTNIPLIRRVAETGKPVIISTGGGMMDDVERAHDAAAAVNDQVCLLQCTAGYPPDWDELNLRVIATYRERFPDTVIGLSAHDSGIAMSLVGYVLGARVVEKHFTLNRAMKGTDHAFSLEPQGLAKLVRDLRRTRSALGDGKKTMYPSEEAPLRKMSKQLVAAHDLEAGHLLTGDDLAVKCPGGGLPPYRIDDVVGRRLRESVLADEPIGEDLLRAD